ncbi:MAG: alpha-amylase family protein [Candidatus Glassbacteria bacterium]
MKFSHRILLPLAAVLAVLTTVEALRGQETRPAAQKPAWWLENGICFTGNWEPLAFQVRRGAVARDWKSDYEWQHEETTVESLEAAGVNLVITHFYKGLGFEHEKQDLEYTRRLAANLKKHEMYAGAYIGSTLFSETLYAEVPGSRSWAQLDRRGEPIVYADQYYRERADFTHEGYREQIRKAVTLAVKDYGMDLIHFDNFYSMFPLEAGYTEHIQQLFREYLRKKYTPDELRLRLGFAQVEGLRPPRVADRPLAPVTDPLVQEWIVFRVEALTGFIRELSEHIRSLSPQVVVEFNPHGIWGENSAFSAGMDHARLLPLSDCLWSEDPDHAHYYPEENRLVSKIRSYKLARRFGNALFSYNNSPLELAEAMAFNRMCIADVPWSVITDPARMKESLTFIRFFHDNLGTFRDLETLADVGVMRDFESVTFGGWLPFLSTVQAEQTLIQSRTPFTLLFEQDWDKLEDWPVVVLASQENLTDQEIGKARRYVERGGALAVVGRATGRFDQWRRERGQQDSFWSLIGLSAQSDRLDQPARLTLGKGRVFYLPGFQSHPSVPESADRVLPDWWRLPLNWEEFLEGLRWCRSGEFSVEVETMPWVAAGHYRAGGGRQVHLVNYWPGHPVRHVPVVFSGKDLTPRSAVLLSPEHEPLPLVIGRYRDGWMTLVPEVKTYGIVVVK